MIRQKFPPSEFYTVYGLYYDVTNNLANNYYIRWPVRGISQLYFSVISYFYHSAWADQRGPLGVKENITRCYKK